MKNFVFNNGTEKLEFSAGNGRLLSFESEAGELLAASEQAFVLRFLQPDGEFLTLTENDFSTPVRQDETLCWKGCSRFPSLVFTLSVKAGKAGEGFRLAANVSGIPEELKLDFCEPVRVTVPYDDRLMIPHYEGYIPNANMKEWRPVFHFDFGNDGMSYPGIIQMQFLFADNGKSGLYYAADDYTHSLKTMEYHADVPKEKIGYRIEYCAGESYGKTEYALPGELILRRTAPDWRAACEIYREWIKLDPKMQQKAPHPSWLDEPLTVITYPVCGRKDINPEPNNFLPYDRPLPVIEKLAETFGTRVMVLLSRWDHNGPWLPPFLWPPFGGADSFRRLRDALHAKGHLFAVYGSGTSYTMKSKMSDYSGVAEYEKRNLAPAMARGPKGERETKCCSYFRVSEAFCLTEKAGKDILTEQTLILADEKVDYFQLLDQNLGGKNFPCYAKNHHHVPVPGRWEYESMRELLDELNRKIAEHGSSMLLGTEGAAAGPLVTAMPFNDLRYNSNFTLGTPVPAFEYVFHAYSNNFLGNQCSMGQTFDFHQSPENLQYRLAYGFSAGAMLTVTLRDTGEIDWGAAADWDQEPPPQEPALRLIRELNKVRSSHLPFLMHGEMCMPRHTLKCGSYEISYFRKDLAPLQVPSVLQSAWRAPDGRRAEFFVNYLNRAQEIILDGEKLTLAPLSVLIREDPA